jgi:hypothetical protein
MRVLVAHHMQSGSVYHRVTEPVRAIRESGADVEIIVRHGVQTLVNKAGTEVIDVDTEGADVVVLQLPKTLAMLQCIRLLQSRGVAVVVEMDDLLSAVPFGHMGHRGLVRNGLSRLAVDCCREADLVTVTTPGLLEEYAPHGRGVVVANAVARRLAELPPAYERDPEVVTVGWAGSVAGHPYDLQAMGSGLRQALDSTRGRSSFLILGQRYDAQHRLGLLEEPDEVPWVKDPEQYIHRIGELFDVGIAPLRMDRFNECKSWLKPIEYSARGVYCVRARTPEYERLGIGLPAKAAKDWAKWISVGVQDGDRRRELAAAAREKVLAGHLTEHRVEEWISAWRAALERRARTRPAVIGVGS